MANPCKSKEEIAYETIKHALRALRKRHLSEEGAHAPALSTPMASQGSKWKEEAKCLEVELLQCYKAQSQASQRLVVEIAESRASKALVEEKETAIIFLQKELTDLRDQFSHSKMDLEEKIKALEVVVSENTDLRVQVEQMSSRTKNAAAENKILVDRLMLEKMKEAEHLNEVNQLYDDMIEQQKVTDLEKLARQQVDGVVRQSEEGADFFLDSSITSTCK